MPKQRKHLPEPTRQTPPTRKHPPAKPTPQGTKTQIKAATPDAPAHRQAEA